MKGFLYILLIDLLIEKLRVSVCVYCFRCAIISIGFAVYLIVGCFVKTFWNLTHHYVFGLAFI